MNIFAAQFLRKYASLTTVVAIVFTMFSANFLGGIKQNIAQADGHIQITSWAELHAIRDNLAGSYILMNDLSADSFGYGTFGADWTPIGCGSLAEGGSPICASGGSGNTFFTGTLDGNGMTISDLGSANGSNDFVGFFGAINTGANISNLTLENITIDGDKYVGGLIGRAYGGTINNVRITGISSVTTTTNFYTGGLAGYVQNGVNFTHSSSNANVSGILSVGGLFGYFAGSADNSYSTGNVTNTTHHTTGGFAGQLGNGVEINFSYATGDVTGPLSSGGFAGVFSVGSGGSGSINYSYATGDVNITGNETGGFIGSLYSDGSGIKTISNSYARGNIYPGATGINYMAGFIGSGGATNIIENSYSTGLVSQAITNLLPGGFMANTSGTTTCSNSFWDLQTSETARNAAGCAATSKTTAEMKAQGTFTGWDFSTIWGINPSQNDGYPFLRFQGLDSLPFTSTLSPADNATGVPVDTNLILTFTEAVDVETGNINIHKTSDNTLIEAIDVTGGLVTGTGTATITINPTNSLVGETEYYVLIDATAFDDTAGNSFAGIADATAWSFTTADIIAPEISNPLPSGEQPAGTTAVTLSVSTNEIAICKYSTTSGTTFADMTAFTITGATSHSTDVLVNDGESYDYYVLCQDPTLNESIEVAISFSIAETPSPTNTRRSSGRSSVQSRVQNLTNMGNTEAANKLIQQYPHLFTQTVPTTSTQVNRGNVSSTRELQIFLNTNGFPVALSGPGSLNNETDIFGNLTRQALAKFQAANNIAPAVGYFGPITREFIANMNTEAPATTPLVVPSETPITTPVSALTETSEIPQTVRDLTVGMEGTDVTALQKLLIAQGYSIPAGATGYFGQQTQSALSSYQAANNIAPRGGYFGPITREQMMGAGLERLWW